MTGIYLRVKRGDNNEPIEIEHMTDDERKEKFGDTGTTAFLSAVCAYLNMLQPLLEGLEKDGIIERGMNTWKSI